MSCSSLSTHCTVHSSSFHVPCRISTIQGKQYSTYTDGIRENGTVCQMNDLILVKGNEFLPQTQIF